MGKREKRKLSPICTQDVIGRNTHNYEYVLTEMSKSQKVAAAAAADLQQHTITIRAPVGAKKIYTFPFQKAQICSCEDTFTDSEGIS